METTGEDYGTKIKANEDMTRFDFSCAHQSGVLYIIPAQSSWVCQGKDINAHALAGFFKQLSQLEDSRIHSIMQRWGLYYRPRSIETEEAE